MVHQAWSITMLPLTHSHSILSPRERGADRFHSRSPLRPSPVLLSVTNVALKSSLRLKMQCVFIKKQSMVSEDPLKATHSVSPSLSPCFYHTHRKSSSVSGPWTVLTQRWVYLNVTDALLLKKWCTALSKHQPFFCCVSGIAFVHPLIMHQCKGLLAEVEELAVSVLQVLSCPIILASRVMGIPSWKSWRAFTGKVDVLEK